MPKTPKGKRIVWIPAVLLVAVPCLAAPTPQPVKEPASIDVEVRPEQVERGGEAAVTVRIVPKPGIKINRYPKIKLVVPAHEGLVAGAEAAVGNPKPPPADQLEANYFKPSVDPVELTLTLDPAAPAGPHTVPADLKYFYCVEASGYCAPKKVSLEIPLTVR